MATLPESDLQTAAVGVEPPPQPTSASAAALRNVSGALGLDGANVRKRLASWAGRGGVAILDQGLISGSNFVISILLARWLTSYEYGAYAIAFGIFVLLSLVYQSLVLEPMAVFGGSSYSRCLRKYVGTLLRIHVVVSLAIFAVLGVSALIARAFLQQGALAGALAGVTAASPCVLVFWLARRTFYLELAPTEAAAGSFLYSALILSGLYVAYHHRLLSPLTAFLLIAVGALVTACALWLRLQFGLARGEPGPTLLQAWRRHWAYGRWALASCIAGWIPAYIYYPVLSSFSGIAASGQLKALMNLTLPLEQTKAALSMLFLPYAASVAARKAKASSTALAAQMTLLAFFGGLAYWGIILPFRRPVFGLLYSGRYTEVLPLLPVVALGSIFWSAAYGPAITLRAMESPDSVFKAFATATVASLVIGIPATWLFGLKGAIWGSNLGDIASLIMVFWVLRRKLVAHPIAPTAEA